VVKILAVGINARFTHSCLALFYLRREIEANLPGSTVRILQCTINDPVYALFQQLTDEAADYLFFSAAIWNSDLVERLIEDLLQLSAGPMIVVGGPQAAVVGSRFADSPRVSVFSGAIETAGPAFYRDLREKKLAKSYQAPSFQAAGLTVASPYRPGDFSSALRDRAVYYESSRGCPFACTYCLSSVERGLYHKDLLQVREELAAILVHRPKSVRFVDRTFNDVPQRALAIWRMCVELGRETLFHFELAPDRFTEELFAFLETVPPGRFQFEIGLQSTNPETLAAIKREVDLRQAAENVKRLRRLETIHLHLDLILGLPFETAATFSRSVNEALAMEPHYLQMGLLKVLPDTELARQAEAYAYRWSRRPPYPVLATRWLEPEVLRDLYRLGECLESCVNNRFFVSLWRYLVRSGEDLALFFSGLSRLFLEQGYYFKAATQETLCGLLTCHVAGRADYPLCRELLIYDWLRCGHRFLPESLQQSESSFTELRDQVYRTLPGHVAGLFDEQGRNHFIRKHVFYRFQPQTLAVLGYGNTAAMAVLCFTAQREDTVQRHVKTVVLALSD
jgi:radical SAM superfamily enzyme YgiQ (UPF0313 family)